MSSNDNISKEKVSLGNVETKELSNPSVILRFVNSHYFFIGILILIYIIMIFIVNPIGDFPLNDDWIFAQPVSSLVNHGIYSVTNNYAPIIIAQVLWGSLFCLITGFSFTTLHISTLVLGLAGAIVFYFLIYDLSKNKKLSFLAALLLLINPIYFNLSNTFMTDVPFLTMALFSIFFFFKYIGSPQLRYIILATLFSVLATLVRQFGIVIPIAFALSEAIRQKQTLVHRLKYFAPAVITVAILEIALTWLKYIGSDPAPAHNVSILSFFSDPKFWLSEILFRSENILFYFGLLFFPLLVFIKIPLFKGLNLFIRLSIMVALLVFTALFIHFYNGFPTVNILNSGYLGPKTLSDVMIYGIPGHDADHFSDSTLKIIHVIGFAGVILLLTNLIQAIIKFSKNFRNPVLQYPSTGRKQFFVLICALGYIILLFVPFDHFDRYLLPLFPLVCMIIISEPQTNKLVTIPSFIFTCIYVPAIIFFSACGTHNYIAWNRARWQAVNYLIKDRNISIHEIDGGYEVNGWLIGLGREINPHKLWGSVDDNKYMISFGEITGCRTLTWFYYQNYFPYATRCIYVLQTKN